LSNDVVGTRIGIYDVLYEFSRQESTCKLRIGPMGYVQ
jgi:hypothetical protein